MGAGPTTGELFVEQWLDLRRLPLVMDDVGAQAGDIVDHAVRWVARPDGFAPSPLCLLRPLAGAMEHIGEAFAALGEELDAQWRELRAAVVAADALLAGSESAAVDGATLVALRLARPAA